MPRTTWAYGRVHARGRTVTTILAGGERGLVAVQEQPYGWEVWERADAAWSDRRVHDLIQLAYGAILAGTDRGLWASTDFGLEWRRLLEGNIRVIRAHPEDPRVLFAGVEPGVSRRSRDGGVNWEQLETIGTAAERERWRRPGPTPLSTVPGGYITDFAFGRGGCSFIYASVDGGGIFRSDDLGASWNQCGHGLPTRSIYRLATHATRPRILFAATDFGVYRGLNGGDDWELVPLGAGAGYTRALAVLAAGLSDEPPTLLAAPSEVDRWGWAAAAGGASCRLYRSIDDGANWRPVTSGLPVSFPEAVQALVSHPDVADLACVGTLDGRVYLSRDRGLTWLQIAEELGPIAALLPLRDD